MATLMAGACGGPTRDEPIQPSTVLVWVPGGVSDQVAKRVADTDGVTRTTEVLGGTLDLSSSTDADGDVVSETTDGRAIPLDTLAYDHDTFERFTDPSTTETLSTLGPGDAVLGATSARLRGIGVGGTLELNSGDALTIRAVLDDEAIAAAEVVVSPEAAPTLGIGARRFVLAQSDRPPEEAVASIQSASATDDPLRVVSAEDVRWAHHSDQVAPQAMIKEYFGEFSARPAPDGMLSPDPEWVEANIVTESVPLLGTVTCHRLIIEPLRQALGQLEERGLGDTVDPEGYSGCYYPRQIKGLPYLSRHSWGIALDLNIASDERGRDVEFAPELVDAMYDVGFTSGPDWPLPDPAHFEFLPPL